MNANIFFTHDDHGNSSIDKWFWWFIDLLTFIKVEKPTIATAMWRENRADTWHFLTIILIISPTPSKPSRLTSLGWLLWRLLPPIYAYCIYTKSYILWIGLVLSCSSCSNYITLREPWLTHNPQANTLSTGQLFNQRTLHFLSRRPIGVLKCLENCLK